MARQVSLAERCGALADGHKSGAVASERRLGLAGWRRVGRLATRAAPPLSRDHCCSPVSSPIGFTTPVASSNHVVLPSPSHLGRWLVRRASPLPIERQAFGIETGVWRLCLQRSWCLGLAAQEKQARPHRSPGGNQRGNAGCRVDSLAASLMSPTATLRRNTRAPDRRRRATDLRCAPPPGPAVP